MKLVIPGGILASFCFGVGSLWDTVIHIQIGHTLLAPAHLFIIASVFLFALAGGVAFWFSRETDLISRKHLKTVAWGGGTCLFAILVVDELWHLIFGLNTSGWSPPHLLFWGGSLVELFGLLMFERWTSGEYRYPDMKIIRLPQILIAASMFSILLFLFLEFDVPHSHIAEKIPALTYPLLATFLFTSGTLVIKRAAGRAFGTTTGAAALAWLFFWSTGSILEDAYRFKFVEPPFPLLFLALFIDLWPAISWQQNCARSLREYMHAALAMSGISYWAIIIWASSVTKLPQQISGNFYTWAWGFVVYLPGLAIISGVLVWLIGLHIAKLENLAKKYTTARN